MTGRHAPNTAEIAQSFKSLATAERDRDHYRLALKAIARRGCSVLGGGCTGESRCPACLAAQALTPQREEEP